MKELTPELLDEIVRRLAAAIAPLSIRLFGSYASGKPTADSDVDLLAVVPDGAGPSRQLARQGRRSLWGLGVPVDLVVCTASDMSRWSGVKCSLLHAVAEKGREVYAAKDRTGSSVAREGR